jgi:hypothetical protein
MDLNSIQSLANPNGNQQPGGNKRKERGNNHKVGKNNNKSKDGTNNDRSNNNVGEGKKEKWKVKFPCKIYKYDHLTHLCPKIEESSRLLSQSPAVLTNPFSHNHHMTLGSFNARNSSSGSQTPSTHEGRGNICVNMLNSHIDVATRYCDYGSSQTFIGIDSPPPLETNLQIEKSKPLPYIPKGVLKLSTHNPNSKSSHNYSIIKDLGQTPCTMSALEVLHTCPS